MSSETFAFVAEPLDRADALRDDPDRLAAYFRHSRIIVLDEDGKALASEDGSLLQRNGLQLEKTRHIDQASAIFLGVESNAEGDVSRGWFAMTAAQAGMDAPQRIDLRTAAAQWPAHHATLFAQARAMLHWQARHRFCSHCGGLLHFVRAGWEAHCDGCNSVHYPRTDPAIIVAVSDGPRLLLGRQAGWPPHRYSTLAGFVEPGESLEQAVAREVLEESGVRVRCARYLASQPWPFPGSLMLGFVAVAEPDEPTIGDELEDACWFSRDQIGAALRGETDAAGLELSPTISISRWLVEAWYRSIA